MEKKYYYINVSNFSRLIAKLLLTSTVIAPIKTDKHAFLEEINTENAQNIDLLGYRTVESFKSAFFKVSEKVASYFSGVETFHEKSLTLMGMRGCDLEALEVVDRVLVDGDFKDPFYLNNINDVMIFGTDCTDCGATCFCTMVKGRPYPVKLFDINLSPIMDGYLVEAGSDKGDKFIMDNPELFDKSDNLQLSYRENNRKNMIKMLDDNNREFFLKHEISDSHKANITNKLWKKLTKDCVECSACNFICPTCTCFLLLDQEKGRSNERYKVWDACLKSSYAKVAGGANPRGKLHERLQNRYHCKFDYSFDRLGRYTCVGCGRCIDGCAGNIDMRKIFIELERAAPLAAEIKE